MKKFFQKLLSGEFKNKYIFISFLLLGIAIYSPYITSPFYYDDFFFFSAIEQNYQYNEFIGFWAARVEESPSFKAVWWQDSDASVKFIRPVPAFVISKCIKIFGREAPLPLHLLSIILHSIIAFTVFLLFNRLSGKYAVSLTAGFLYLICIHFSGTIGWISAMTDIMAVLFMNLSLYYYVKSKESDSKLYFFLSTIFLIIALLCKETAVIAPVAILLCELINNNDRTQRSVKGVLKAFFLKWKSWGFSLIILILFLAVYKLGGFGARSALYYNPFSEPVTYLSKSLIGFPMLILPYLSIFPTSFSTFMPELLKPTVISGYIMFLIFLVSLISYRRDKILQFSFLLLLISFLPQFSTDASERQLYYPYVAGSFIISFLIFQLKYLKKKYSPESPPRIKYLGTAFGIYLFVSSLALSFILSFYYPYSFKTSMDNPQEFVLESKKITDQKNPSKIIYLNTSGPFITLYVNDVFRYYTGEYKDINILSGFNGEIWMKKLSDSSFVLKTDSKGWISNMFAKVLRSGPLVEKGKIYSRKDFNAMIVKTTADNKDVLEVRFDFKYNLDDHSVPILYYDGTEVKVWSFKSHEIGKWVLVGNTSDVMKSLFE
jgi:Dolichyl-phosphate-mannose-protein mannosyltransferase